MVKAQKSHRKMKITLITAGVLLLIIAGALAGTRMYIKNKLSQIKSIDLPDNPEDLGIDKDSDEDLKNNTADITNILLLGVDTRDPEYERGRSDAMMVMTIDKTHNKLKLTSIMRDSLVTIEGYGQEKITNAHAYGGPLLAIKTVNQNYKLNIANYVKVNFFGLEKIIDYVGGVTINVTEEERKVANSYISEVAGIERKKPNHIKKAGKQTLSGSQAVAYARIRYVGHSDFQRTERQRTVLTALFSKLSKKNVVEITGVANTIIPYVETSLKPDYMISAATYILAHKMTDVEQSRVPYNDLYRGAVVNGRDVLIWDKEPTIERFHKFIFEDKSE